MRLLAFVAVMLVLAAPASAGAASRLNHRGVLRGVVTRGPACSPGQPGPCGDPIAGVTIRFLHHGNAVAQTTTAADGTYRIRLHAGNYGIQLPGRNQWRPTQARVLRGRVTRNNIAIDSLTG